MPISAFRTIQWIIKLQKRKHLMKSDIYLFKSKLSDANQISIHRFHLQALY
jgi:hypothetical protein